MSALAAECNGIEKQPHVRGKLTYIVGIAEVVFVYGIVSAIEG